MEYNPGAIEPKWKKYWDEQQTYKVTHRNNKPKYYVLDMFPYPSGSGLHVGHPTGYFASDIYARFKRLKGFNVLHPMGFDAFGLPAEQYAIEKGIHPAISTDVNINTYRQQLDKLGFCFDWNREVRTCDPTYYKWTQWIFLQLFEHYYDLNTEKAVPVKFLVSEFEEKGNKHINAATTQEKIFTAAEWRKLSALEKSDILMNYRLAYRKTGYVWWCEALGTVLANDEVKEGVSERGGHPVEKRPMLQWSLRITAYAERLLNDLDTLDWSESLKTHQRNWIGRSEGATVYFDIAGFSKKLEIFTTRPDTIFGATFMVLAPEHQFVNNITTSEQKEAVKAYLQYTKSRSERDRMAEVKEVTGCFTGAYAIHPFTNEQIPVWISEYVLKDYGTGAIMAVPSDDERDYAFAKHFDLPIIDVVDKSAYPGSTLHDKEGHMINSDFLDGMEVPAAIDLMIREIDTRGIGRRRINYKLRDANFSRQRYWGEPFPIIYDKKGEPIPLGHKSLPLELPYQEQVKSQNGKSPLATNIEWAVLEDGKTRETDTMPGYAGSSWYFLRYMDPHNENYLASKEAIMYWKEVDLYVGGTEHAVGHLMYSRFWHKFLYDKGIVPTIEPFKKLINQGMILGRSLYIQIDKAEGGRRLHVPISLADDKDRLYRTVFEQLKKDDSRFEDVDNDRDIKWEQDDKGLPFVALTVEIEKMSKSKYNVVNPDEMVAQFGADCFRMYEMFLGPIEQSKPWDTKGIDGVNKFLRKLWGLFYDNNGQLLVSDESPSKDELKVLHTCIKKVTEDIERFSFNTCVSAFMVCVNELKRLGCSKKDVLMDLSILIAPFAPHLSEELWEILGQEPSIHKAVYPVWNDEFLVEDHITYPICINGKRRGEITVTADAVQEDIEAQVRNMEAVQKWLEGQIVKKVIIVPGRMVNLVI